MPEIVMVEDDAVISELISFNLQNEGYAVCRFPDGKSLFKMLSQEKEPLISLFILDIMLPGMDGFEICAALRQDKRFATVPILMLTARGSESDKVRGLTLGADDYLAKPFGMRELLARVQALHRRYRINSDVWDQNDPASINHDRILSADGDTGLTRPGIISESGLTIDDVRHRVYRNDQEIDLTHREYELLKFLMIHKGVAYSRDDLLNQVWGYDYSGETRTVDVHIRQLRRKLEQSGADPDLIETVRGRGYRFHE